MLLTLLSGSQAGSGAVTGTLAAVESGADVLAAQGSVLVSGSLAGTEAGSDVFAAAGSTTGAVSGALAATETGADALAASGQVIVIGSLAAAEAGADVLASAGQVVVAGSVAAVEVDSDAFAASGTVLIFGAFAASELSLDTFAASGSTLGGAAGSLAATETNADVFVSDGVVVTNVTPQPPPYHRDREMTNSQILDLVLLRLKQRTDAEVRAGALLEALLATDRYAGAEVPPWFLKHTVSFTIDTTSNGVLDLTQFEDDGYYFYGFDEDSLDTAIAAYPATGTLADRYPITLRPQSQLFTNRDYPAGDLGQPTFAYLQGSKYINFRPWPDQAYVVAVTGYWQQDVFADTSVVSLWSKYAPDVLVAEAAYQVASKHIGDQDLAVVLQSEIGRAWKRLKDQSVARKHAGMLFAAGEED